jgi:diguanylate cyclase (GGDEF)-like protein
MSYPALFSILFFLVSVVSIVSGILVLLNNPKAPGNRCFFAIVIAISFWSVGLGFANIAPDAATCNTWRHFSAIGWGTIYAIVLHFFLIITGKKTILKKWWFYLFLYLPAIICLLAFAIPSSLNPNPYNLQRTEFGWVNVKTIAEHNIWDWIFRVYYIGYSLIGLMLLLQWGRRASEYNIKMQARIMSLSFAAALVLASITDVLLGNFFAQLPQMAPIILLIPIVAIYHAIEKYGFILSEPAKGRTSYLRIIVSVTLYLVLTLMQAISSTSGRMVIIGGLTSTAFQGIITQFQVFIAIYLVLIEDRPGYITALLLNAGSIFSLTSFMIRQKTTLQLPGVVSYLGMLLVIVLIASYKRKTAAYIEKIDSQRKFLEESEKKLYKMAYYDSLTGLHNRQWFMEYLNKSIHGAQRRIYLIGVFFIDLDSFKSINDTMGHSFGDHVLRLLAQRLSSCIRGEDAIARFSGDEFLIMVSNISNMEDLRKITARIMRVFKTPITLQNIEYFISASVGVAVYPEDGLDAETLIKNAEIAMYIAKNKGKNQYVFCTSTIKKDTIKKMELTNQLYRALANKELLLYYQPQVRADTQKIAGFEALLRWNNKKYGLVTPDVFIPMAEQTGLIRSIGLWVFKTACEDLKAFQERFYENFSMSINLSPEQLRDIDIANKINRIIKETGTNPASIQVEITESIALTEDSIIQERLEELKALGLSVAIDDFGTGFSSFTRLKTFPIDLLKIDTCFVHGISSGSRKDRSIIKSIIQLAKNLGIETLAEGVETKDQFMYLKDNGCNLMQGYYFYKPMPAEEIKALR